MPTNSSIKDCNICTLLPDTYSVINKATAIENGVAMIAASNVTAKDVTIIAAAPTWFLPAPGFQSVEKRK